MPGMRQQYRDLIAQYGVIARDADACDGIEIGAANMYRLAAAGRGSQFTLTEAAFTGAVLYTAGHKDSASFAGHHTMLHETLHTCGPLIDNTTPAVVAVEELVTELATREMLRITLSIAYDEVPLTAGVGQSGYYQDLIDLAAAALGGDRGAAITALADAALRIKAEMAGKRGSYQVIGALLVLAGCSDVSGCSERILLTLSEHRTQTLCDL